MEKDMTPNLEIAMRNPAKAFATPSDVIHHADLSQSQKIDLLKQWEYDLREQSVATEENMDGKQTVELGAILQALESLKANRPASDSASKHGGG